VHVRLTTSPSASSKWFQIGPNKFISQLNLSTASLCTSPNPTTQVQPTHVPDQSQGRAAGVSPHDPGPANVACSDCLSRRPARRALGCTTTALLGHADSLAWKKALESPRAGRARTLPDKGTGAGVGGVKCWWEEMALAGRVY